MFSSWKISKKFNFGGNHEKHEKQLADKQSQKLEESVVNSSANGHEGENSPPTGPNTGAGNTSTGERRQTIVPTPNSVAPVRLSSEVSRSSMDTTRTNNTHPITTTTNEICSNYSSTGVSVSELGARQQQSTVSVNGIKTHGLEQEQYEAPPRNFEQQQLQSRSSQSPAVSSSGASSSISSSASSMLSSPASENTTNSQIPTPSPIPSCQPNDILPENQQAGSSLAGIMTIKIYSGDSFKLPFPIIYNQQLLSRLLGSSNTKQAPNLMDDLNKYMEILSLNHNSRSGDHDSGMSLNGTDRSSDNFNNSSVFSSNTIPESNDNDSDFDAACRDNQENVIPGDVATNYIPAAITLPGSTDLNPLIYFTIEFDNTTATIEPESGTMNHPVFNKISTFDVTRKLPYLKIDVFCRVPSILLPQHLLAIAGNNSNGSSELNNPVQNMVNKVVNNQDIHLVTHNIPLNLNFTTASNIRIFNHKWITINELGTRLNLTIDYKPLTNKKLSIDDFELLKVIGKGSFGKVMQVKKKDTNKIYALKAIRKSYIVSNSEVTHTLAERTVLAQIQCPFIVPLKFSFQSKEKLYLVLALINGGELFYHLQKEGRFTLSRSRFYAAELLVALESLHSLNVIYRDLKPENILLDYQGHIALCDFGLCKLDMKDKDKTSTFCGTPEYLAPELLLGEGYTRVVDWWTLGVLLYEMLTGLPPYYDEDIPTMYKKILQEPLRFPEGFDEDAKDLLVKLLNRDPKKRLGSKGSQEIKSHRFFSQLSWKRLTMKGYIPPYKPPVQNSLDTSNFDSEFTKEKPVDSVVCDFLSESVQQQFGGWTYVGNEQLDAGSVMPK